uniref:Uncharacterized protein n=1 Tax=Podoviridae sp. ctiuS14 TaxID=2827620 RepID=A0A8S5LME8_9CAUD|nr:MAG TPA: hypothetical protein [Podoviridae sp. ctiuS14]
MSYRHFTMTGETCGTTSIINTISVRPKLHCI